jgi:NAD-dependent SIR2 family protein deacetylase
MAMKARPYSRGSTIHSRIESLSDFIERHSKLFVLTGAGCSTESGIPDYRDDNGEWKRTPPVMFQAFSSDVSTRRRYWARSFVGWQRFGHAAPNAAHRALAALEKRGRLELLVTQNVDRLHQAAGSANVVDLHGRLDQVRCLNCGRLSAREQLQERLLAANPSWLTLDARIAPDGDADLEGLDFATFEVPPCVHCGGVLKPHVVFFGESVPADRVGAAMRAVHHADAMLVVGSSLMIYSGYRFAQAAALAGKPIAAVNLGRTRADALLTLKIAQSCSSALEFLLEKAGHNA